ncbi:MAG: family 16 glycoside hydrolase, partial [Planctomycetota bacterium]|nr:family 16 glycoside hydrolase [Planctomycetota bacterium]
GCKYSCTPEQWIKAWKIGGWNTVKVRCVGKYPLITTWINGVKICEFDGAAFEHSGYNKDRVHQTLGDKGSIAVQVHGGGGWPNGAKVRWKNIRIKPL